MNTKVATNSQVGCSKMHNSSCKTLDNHRHNYLKPNERKVWAIKQELLETILKTSFETRAEKWKEEESLMTATN